MKKTTLITAVLMLFTLFFILSSCSAKTKINEPADRYTDVTPEKIITGPFGFGEFKLTVYDSTKKDMVLEYSDPTPSVSTEGYNVNINKIYTIKLTGSKIYSNYPDSVSTENFSYGYSLFDINGYEIYVRTEISGRDTEKYKKSVLEGLDEGLSNGSISSSIYNKYVSILEGKNILHEKGSVFYAFVGIDTSGKAHLCNITENIDGSESGKHQTDVSSHSDFITITNTDKDGVAETSYYDSGIIKSENRVALTDAGKLTSYKEWSESGSVVNHYEIVTSGNTETKTTYHTNGAKKDEAVYTLTEEGSNPTSFTEWSENGNLIRNVDYFDSGRIKTDTRFNADGSEASRTEYTDGAFLQSSDGENIVIDDFIELYGGYWTADKYTVQIGKRGEEPFINVYHPSSKTDASGYNVIQQITYKDGIYSVTLDQYKKYRVCFSFSNNKMSVIFEDDSVLFFSYSADFDNKEPKPELIDKEVDITVLDKFLGSWSDYYYRSQGYSFIKLGNRYIINLSRYETDLSATLNIDRVLFDGVNKYTAVFKSGYQSSVGGTTVIEQTGAIVFYDIPDGKYRQIAMEGLSLDVEIYVYDPLIQINENFKFDTFTYYTTPIPIDAYDFVTLFEGTFTDISGSISIGIVEGKPRLVREYADGSVETYFITDVRFYEKREEYILTLTNTHHPFASASLTLNIKPTVSFDTITVYENRVNRILERDDSKEYPYHLHSETNRGVKIRLDNLDEYLGTWSEADLRRDMLHIYKENGEYKIIFGYWGVYYSAPYTIEEVYLDNRTFILYCTDEDGNQFTTEFIGEKSSEYEAIGDIYESITYYSEGFGTSYYKDPNLCYPLDSEFPYGEVVLDLLDTQIFARLNEGKWRNLSKEIAIVSDSGKVYLDITDVNGLNGRYEVLSVRENTYYKTYSLTISGADGTTELLIRPKSQGKTLLVLDKIDSENGSISFTKARS